MLIQSKTLKSDDPEYRAVVADVAKRLDDTAGVRNIAHALHEGPGQRAGLRRRPFVMVNFEMKGDPAEPAAMKQVDRTVAVTEAAQKAHPEFNIEQFGSASSEDAFQAIFQKDLQKATFGSLPITLILLVLAFGTLVAAGSSAAAGDHRCRRRRWASSAL